MPQSNPVATAKMSKGKWYVECSIVGAKPTRMVFFAWQKENESCRRANSNTSAKQRRHPKLARKQKNASVNTNKHHEHTKLSSVQNIKINTVLLLLHNYAQATTTALTTDTKNKVYYKTGYNCSGF